MATIILFSILLKVVGSHYANSVSNHYRRLSLPERALISSANWISGYWIVIAILMIGLAAFIVFRQRARATSEVALSQDDRNILNTLVSLCKAYAANDKASIMHLEPKATRIGEALNKKGGIMEMRKVFSRIPDQQGKRTLEMHWDGIGDWRG